MKIFVDRARVEDALQIHAFAFGVLGWIDHRARADPRFLTPTLEAQITDRARCRGWLEGCLADLPGDAPTAEALPRVAAMLSSFFDDGFRIDRPPGDATQGAKIVRRPGPPTAPQVVGRRRGGKDPTVIALRRMAIAAGHRPPQRALVRVARRASLVPDLELWVYAVDLVARAHGKRLGVASATLWRRIDVADRRALGPAIEAARGRLLAAVLAAL